MFVNEARRYLAERILSPRIGLLWLFLSACALPMAGAGRSWVAAAAALFILAFRLWDDLADLEHDRLRHPGRVLLRTPDLRSFQVAQWALLALLALSLAGLAGGTRSALFLLLVAAFLANYRLSSGRPALRPMRAALVLAKYPAFILLTAEQPGAPLALGAAAAAYIVPLVDEVRSSGAAVLPPATILFTLALLAGYFLLN